MNIESTKYLDKTYFIIIFVNNNGGIDPGNGEEEMEKVKGRVRGRMKGEIHCLSESESELEPEFTEVEEQGLPEDSGRELD